MGMISTECGSCPLAEHCGMREKSQRRSYADGGLGLCPKLRTDEEISCQACPFRKSSETNVGIYHCSLLHEANVTHIVHRKTKCPLAAEIRKEKRGG